MAQVRLLRGTNLSARAAHVDALLREHWPSTLLLVPTQALAIRRTEALFADGVLAGAWGRPVMSLTDFAAWILTESGAPPRRVDDFERRLILERVLTGLYAGGQLADMPDPAMAPGMARHVLAVITALKQAAVEPEDFRTRLGGQAQPFDLAVASAYAAYQQALLDANAYDVAGLFWKARLQCAAGKPAALDGVNLLALDGFDDFTPSELSLIEAVAAWVPEMVIGLNHDDDPDRGDLFALSETTREALRTRFDPVQAAFDTPEPDCHASWLGARLFWRNWRPCPEGLRENLRIVPCIDPAHEAQVLGRAVKRLLLAGVSAAEIAVVYRDPAVILPVLRDTFAEYGIPLAPRDNPPLRKSAVGAFLGQFFEALRGWPREGVVAVLMSPWFNAGTAPDPAIPSLARAAHILNGRDAWEEQMADLRDALREGREETITRLLRRVPDAEARCTGLLERVAWLQTLASEFPENSTQAAYAHALDRLLDALRVEETASTLGRGEVEAVAALRGLLESLVDCAGGQTLDKATFLNRLGQGMASTAYPMPRAANGVLCTTPDALRGLRFAHVFYAGLNEGAVPRRPPANAVYSERDLDRLAKAGIALERAQARHDRERLLFHHVVSAAAERLTLSWCVLGEGGREALPSPFIADVEEIFAGHLAITAPVPASDGRCVASGEALAPREYCVAAAREGALTLLEEHVPQVAHALAVQERRFSRKPFDACDGVIGDRALAEAIARHYGPDHHFSANQLEGYLACPFRFFAERLLDLTETEEPDAEFDPRVRGLILHEILQRFHRGFLGKAIPGIDPVEAGEAMDAIVEEVFLTRAWRSAGSGGGIVAAEARRMRAALTRYLALARDDEEEAAWAPRHFEASFGRTPRKDADEQSREEPYFYAEDILLAGVVDRIDVGANGLRIVDYKTGAIPAPKDVKSGLDLQLTLYAKVVEALLLPGSTCVQARYLSVGKGKKGVCEVIATRGKEWEGTPERAEAAVRRAVAGIRAAHFPPTPATENTCDYCPHRAVCRYEEHRVSAKLGEGDGA